MASLVPNSAYLSLKAVPRWLWLIQIPALPGFYILADAYLIAGCWKPLPPSGCGDIGMLLLVPNYFALLAIAVIVGLIDVAFLTINILRRLYFHFPPRQYTSVWIIGAMVVVALICVIAQLPYLLR